MNYLFEKSDALNTPIECFDYIVSEDNFPIKPHWHYFLEMIYMNSGEADMQAGGSVYHCKAGDMVLFHPKGVHSITSDNPDGLRYSVIKVDINRIALPSDYAPKIRSIFKAAEQRGMGVFFSREQADLLNAKEIFSTCIRETQARRYGFDVMVRSCIQQLLIGVLRIWQESGFIINEEVFAEDSVYDIYSITEYIDENLSKGIKVSDISQMCGMSYSYFAKRFQRLYGKTCKEYMEEMRIVKAEEFLLFTDFDLTYISQETGFSDCSHLIKSFKRRNGVTPKQFRNRRRTV